MSITVRPLILLALCALARLFGADLGLGPVPTKTTLAAPGPIGATSPSTGAFTSITADIGTGTAPATKPSNLVLTLNATDGQFPRVYGESYGNTGLVISGRAVSGTRALPTATAADQSLFAITALGYDGTTYPTGSNAQISINAGSLWTSSNRETYQKFLVTANGSTSAVETMRLTGAGSLSMMGNGNTRRIGFNFFGSDTWGFYTDGSSDAAKMTVRYGTTDYASFDASGNFTETKNLIGSQGHGLGVTSTATAAGTTALSTSTTAVQVFTGSTTQTVTLPAANAYGSGNGYLLIFKNVSSGTVTVNRAGSDTINTTSTGQTSFTITANNAALLVSDGSSAWEKIL